LPTKEEHVDGRTLVLRYDASGRLLSAKIRGVTHPWLELDPNIPAGEVHWAHFGDKSIWRDGVHYESNGGPWEAERTTKKPYEQFVAEELQAMRDRLVRRGSE
jgi:YD repeat-containing protein